jgi:hypothetical protein
MKKSSGQPPPPKEASATDAQHAGASGSGDPEKLLLFLLFHVPLALLMRKVPGIATTHALLTLSVGLLWAVSRQRLERVAYWGAYITGAEVLWRMTGAHVSWEFGKYAAAAVCIVAIVRSGFRKGPALPLVYFCLLLPSLGLALLELHPAEARNTISFNLSGPFALMVSAWFFSRVEVSVKQIYTVFLSLIAPVTGIASITLLATVTTATIDFGSESNIVTSGGFGPNQVSSVLGLAALMVFLSSLDNRLNRSLWLLMFGLMNFLAVESAMTFSRGGLYTAAGGALIASGYFLRDTRLRTQVILTLASAFVIMYCVLLLNLDTFTGGRLSQRFKDTHLTGREAEIWSDLTIWLDHPILGVGPGRAARHRTVFLRFTAAHTEPARLLAEHGIFGLAALVSLMIAGVGNLSRARTAGTKALTASILSWAFLYTLINATRLLAPSFLFGLSFATILTGEDANFRDDSGAKIRERS